MIDIDGYDIAFCSLEDMIILKVFAGRTRDIDDLEAIIKKNPDYDKYYIVENLKELGNSIDLDLVSRFLEIELDSRS